MASEDAGFLDASRGAVIEKRFNPDILVFLHVCVMQEIVQPAEMSSLAFQEKLSRLKDKLL